MNTLFVFFGGMVYGILLRKIYQIVRLHRLKIRIAACGENLEEVAEEIQHDIKTTPWWMR